MKTFANVLLVAGTLSVSVIAMPDLHIASNIGTDLTATAGPPGLRFSSVAQQTGGSGICFHPNACPECANVTCGLQEHPEPGMVTFCYLGSGCTPCDTRSDCGQYVCCYDMCFAPGDIEACDRPTGDFAP